MFGDIGIFYVSEQQKNLEASYQNNGGYKVPWIDMPVVSPLMVQLFYKISAVL